VLWTVLGVLAAFGGALAAAYFLRLLRRVSHGAASPAVAASGPARLSLGEVLAWSPLVVLTLAVGLIPALVLRASDYPVALLLLWGSP
jgi:NADH-quinone oxidoreductase subunit M